MDDEIMLFAGRTRDNGNAMMWTKVRNGILVVVLVAGGVGLSAATQAADAPARNTDWPQYRGPNRDHLAVNCPKLLDAWPKEGPPLVWKSDLIPGWYQGGCSGPVVADGKVFVYATAKIPTGGGTRYRMITPDVLANAGWLADLPEDLAKKIEEARTSPKRPKTSPRGVYFRWWGADVKAKDKERDAYLGKRQDLDKYIKDFLDTLSPEQAAKYGDYARKRLCMTPESVYNEGNGYSLESLARLSKLCDAEYGTCREWAQAISEATKIGYPLFFHLDSSLFFDSAWWHCFTRSDTLVCLDAATGKTLWRKEFPLDAEATSALTSLAGANPLGISATPAVWKGKCYFAGVAGLYCVSAADGAVVWQAKCKPAHASPLVAEGVAYHCGTAYEAETGQVLWKFPGAANGRNYGPACVVHGGKTYVLAGNGAKTMHCLELKTGKELATLAYRDTPWTAEVQVAGDVLLSQGKVYRMTPAGMELVKTLVDFPGVSFGLSGIVYQGHVYQYIFKGEMSARSPESDKYHGLCCVDMGSGDLKWAYKGPTCMWDTDYTPSILADGKMFMAFGSGSNFMTQNDGVAMVLPTPEKYTLLGSFKPDLIPWTPMAMAGGRLFVRTELGVSCYDLRATKE